MGHKGVSLMSDYYQCRLITDLLSGHQQCPDQMFVVLVHNIEEIGERTGSNAPTCGVTV